MDLKVTGPARRFETRSSEEHRTFARALFARDDVDEVLGPETGKQAKKIYVSRSPLIGSASLCVAQLS